MQRLLDAHHRRCAFVLRLAADDRSRLAGLLGLDRIGHAPPRDRAPVLRSGAARPRLAGGALGIPRDRCLVISVGRLDRVKNVLMLVTALRQLLERGLPVHLLCAGQGPDREAVRAALGEHVTCPGVLDPETLARAYASADLCAQPAVIEELSNAVLEARARGCRCWSATGSGSERFVVEGETGLVVRAAAPRRGRRRCSALRHRSATAAAMGRAARALVAGARPDLAPGAARGLAADLAPRGGVMIGRRVLTN